MSTHKMSTFQYVDSQNVVDSKNVVDSQNVDSQNVDFLYFLYEFFIKNWPLFIRSRSHFYRFGAQFHTNWKKDPICNHNNNNNICI